MKKQNWIPAFKRKSGGFEVDKDGYTEYGALWASPINFPYLYTPVKTKMMPRQETYVPFFKPYRVAQEVPYFKY